jgi:hypothetical protein
MQSLPSTCWGVTARGGQTLQHHITAAAVCNWISCWAQLHAEQQLGDCSTVEMQTKAAVDVLHLYKGRGTSTVTTDI